MISRLRRLLTGEEEIVYDEDDDLMKVCLSRQGTQEAVGPPINHQ